MNLDEIKSRINPVYQDFPGTESHERKWLCDQIDKLTAERYDALADVAYLERCVISHDKDRLSAQEAFGKCFSENQKLYKEITTLKSALELSDAIVAADTALINELKSDVEQLRARVAELEGELLSAAMESTVTAQVEKLTAERDAALAELQDLKNACNLLGIVAKKRVEDYQITTLKSALREAKEALDEITDVFANIGMTSGIYDDEQESLEKACEVIATINAVFKEE